jgi:glycosyltransferase involved in cell wall biosynthesis
MNYQDLPLVSVIIPVYNAAKYLAACIESVIEQSYPAIEIIVVDNGSKDLSEAVAKAFPAILWLEEKKKGASAARNTGIKAAKGRYIQFLDADDFLHPDKIKNQVTLLNDTDDCLALCPTVYFFDGENPEAKEIKHEWFKEESEDTTDFLIKLYGGSLLGPQYGGMIQPNAWLTPKTLIDKAGLWNETLTLDDDGEFFCRVVLAAIAIKYTPKAINYYRKHKVGNNLSAKKTSIDFQSLLTSNQLKYKYLSARSNNPILSKIFSRIYYDNAFTFYPQEKNLASNALKLAKAMNSDYKFTPYIYGFKKILNPIFGWKFIRNLEYLKTKIAPNG